jgi:hypothetical protein
MEDEGFMAVFTKAHSPYRNPIHMNPLQYVADLMSHAAYFNGWKWSGNEGL